MAPIRTEARSSAPVFRRRIDSSRSRSIVLPSARRSAVSPPTIPAAPAAAAQSVVLGVERTRLDRRALRVEHRGERLFDERGAVLEALLNLPASSLPAL